MSYFVLCTFDLKNASRQDYDNAYVDLVKIGLQRVVVSSGGKNVVIPTTTVTGEFTGNSSASVRDYISGKIKSAFTARGFSSEIFVVVGGDWAWSGAAT